MVFFWLVFFSEDPEEQRFARLKLQYQVPPEFSRSCVHIPV